LKTNITRQLASFALAGLVIGAASAVLAQSPIRVFVSTFESDDSTGAAPKELQHAARDADHRRSELEKQLKKELGKNEESWPEDKRATLDDARRAAAAANFEYLHANTKPESLSDTVGDLKDRLAKLKESDSQVPIEVVDTPASADLIVTIAARRSWLGPGPTLMGRDNTFAIYFELRPAPRLAADAFASTRFGPKLQLGTTTVIQTPRADAPSWRFEARGDQKWKNAAEWAAVTVQRFSTANQATLAATSTAAK
jgi:hypothetical protein